VSKEENPEVKFREIQEAYETLSDKSKRQSYNTYGNHCDKNQRFQTCMDLVWMISLVNLMTSLVVVNKDKE
jgi:DnaJ-class molecular chaperone